MAAWADGGVGPAPAPRRRIGPVDAGRVFGQVPAEGGDQSGPALLAQAVDHGGHGVEGVVVPGAAEVGEPSGHRQAPPVVRPRCPEPCGPSRPRRGSRSRDRRRSGRRPRCRDASRAAAAVICMAGARSRVRSRRRKPHVGAFGARPAEDGAVVDSGGAGRRPGRDDDGRPLVDGEHGTHVLGIGLGYEPVVGRDVREFRRRPGVGEPGVAMGGGHRREGAMSCPRYRRCSAKLRSARWARTLSKRA